jgi:hypothetical protein
MLSTTPRAFVDAYSACRRDTFSSDFISYHQLELNRGALCLLYQRLRCGGFSGDSDGLPRFDALPAEDEMRQFQRRFAGPTCLDGVRDQVSAFRRSVLPKSFGPGI